VEAKAPKVRGTRTGFTTGACAAAAAKAATRVLRTGEPLTHIETTLPNGQRVTFALHRCERAGASVVCSVIKDAGDDPDCTHGAELVATVQLRDVPGIELLGGDGVATVTKPGLGLDVGSPAINPVPRRNIAEMHWDFLFGDEFYSASRNILREAGQVFVESLKFSLRSSADDNNFHVLREC